MISDMSLRDSRPDIMKRRDKAVKTRALARSSILWCLSVVLIGWTTASEREAGLESKDSHGVEQVWVPAGLFLMGIVDTAGLLKTGRIGSLNLVQFDKPDAAPVSRFQG